MKLNVGKKIGDSIYLHKSVVELAPESIASLLQAASLLDEAAIRTANVYKFDVRKNSVSALLYPSFFDEPFPELTQSWTIDIQAQRVRFRDYSESINPPILHRKELLLGADHPQKNSFAEITNQAEQLGLFTERHLIGFKRSWQQRVEHAGYVIEDGIFQPIGNASTASDAVSEETSDGQIERHRTALSRSGLSAPMQALARHGFLNEKLSVFDYGCGRGDDLEALIQNGVSACGWDPHFAPKNPRSTMDVVNLGFVINVIEEPQERIEALEGAFSLARQLLVVSTMLYGAAPPAGRRYRDGYLTQRNTFQKYFTQAELKEFVEHVLDVDAIAVAPGIVFAFKDKQAEQRFLYAKQRNTQVKRILGYRRPPRAIQPRVSKKSQKKELLLKHGDLLDQLWAKQLALGRIPSELEFSRSEACIEAFGSWRKALCFAENDRDFSDFEYACEKRRDDLLTYIALELFARRKQYKELDLALRLDIKAQFGSYKSAQEQARAVLLDAANPEMLDGACELANSKGLGHYEPSGYLQLHANLIERLPAVLRVYIGCACILYGDLDDVDLVKIHIRSGKVTLLSYENFDENPLPCLKERTKINLRQQDLDVFSYNGEHPTQVLYFKSRFLSEDYPNYEQQFEFDESLTSLGIVEPNSYGPPRETLEVLLSARRTKINGMELISSDEIPDLEDPCGRFLRYRDFVECSDTWNAQKPNNIPKQAQSYNAIYALASQVLDPVIDYFGMIKLTYGFSCPSLTKLIPHRIAPKLDQHAAYELNLRGSPICPRLGAAVDFIVEDEDMIEVANWIRENVTFDRMYVYGANRPIHISLSHAPSAQVTVMRSASNGKRLIPKNVVNRPIEEHDF